MELQHPLQILIQRLQGVAPGVPLVRYKALKDRQGYRRIPGTPVFHRTCERRNILKADFAQELANFKVRICTLFEPPEEFQDQPVILTNRRSALLHPHQRRLKVSVLPRAS